MAKILTITNTASKTTATASDEKYNYNVEYQVGNMGKTLDSANVSVTDKNNLYVGNVNLNGENVGISAPEAVDVIAIYTMFKSIIAEIRAGLTATEKTTV
jgi:hypothetical protein